MKKFLIVTTVISALLAVAYRIQYHGSERAIIERFPHIDPVVAAEAHRIMLNRTWRRQYVDLELTDDECDEIFLGIVAELQS